MEAMGGITTVGLFGFTIWFQCFQWLHCKVFCITIFINRYYLGATKDNGDGQKMSNFCAGRQLRKTGGEPCILHHEK